MFGTCVEAQWPFLTAERRKSNGVLVFSSKKNNKLCPERDFIFHGTDGIFGISFS